MSSSTSQAALMEAIVAKALSGDKALHILPYYLGGYIDVLLMGVVISQTFTYWQFVTKDKPYIVALVLLAVAGTTAASVVDLCWCLRLFVWGFSTYLPFTEIAWVTRYMSIEIAVIFIVQVFYVTRAVGIFRSYWPALIIGPFVLATTVLGSVTLAEVFGGIKNITPDVLTDSKHAALAYSWLSLILASDLLITVIIIYGLFTVRTGWEHTDSKLKKLMILCFESQVPALIISAVSLVAWNRQFEVALAFIMFITKIYVIGVLVTLNFRAGSSSAGVNVSMPSSSISKSQETTYPMDSFSYDQPGNGQISAQTKHNWRFTPSSDARPADLERAQHDDHSEHVDDKAYGSTTGLNQLGKTG